MTPLERIQTLAAAGNPPPTPPPGCSAELANILGELGRVAMSDSQTSIGGGHNNNNVNRSLRRNRFSFNGRKPSFSWLSSTSSINSTAPVKGDSFLPFLVFFYFGFYFFGSPSRDQQDKPPVQPFLSVFFPSIFLSFHHNGIIRKENGCQIAAGGVGIFLFFSLSVVIHRPTGRFNLLCVFQ